MFHVSELTYEIGARMDKSLFITEGPNTIRRFGEREVIRFDPGTKPQINSKHPGQVHVIRVDNVDKEKHPDVVFYYLIAMSHGPKKHGKLTVHVLKVGGVNNDLNEVVMTQEDTEWLIQLNT